MTQEEKSLVLRDICGRLPYGITIYRITDNSTHYIQYSDILENIDQFSHFLECSGIENIKPYLRPLSSMTEEEKKEERRLWNIVTTTRNDLHYLYTDFLLSHHFDYRGLIEKGLVLEALEGMYGGS